MATTPINRALYFVSFFVIILLSVKAEAQKCNLEKNEIDALTELVIKRTAPEMLMRVKGQPLYVKAQCIGTNKYLKIVFYKYNNFSFQEQREVGFKLSNKEELLLYPRQMSVDSTKMDDLADVYSLLIYKLSDDQYKKLTQYPAVKFKYYLISGFVTEPIKDKNQGKIMGVLKCVE